MPYGHFLIRERIIAPAVFLMQGFLNASKGRGSSLAGGAALLRTLQRLGGGAQTPSRLLDMLGGGQRRPRWSRSSCVHHEIQ